VCTATGKPRSSRAFHKSPQPPTCKRPLSRTVEAQLAALTKKHEEDKKATAKEEQADDENEEGEEETQNIDKNQIRAIQSMNRMNNWAMVHKHQFRDRNKVMEKSSIPFMPKK